MKLDRKIKEIERLLDLYYDGLTSTEQEKELRDFFASEDVPIHLEHEKDMFAFFKEEAEHTYKEEIVSLKKESKLKINWMRYAAAAVLFIGLGWFSNVQYNDYKKQQEVMLAYQQTQEAMKLLASNFSVGVEGAEKIGMMNKTQEKIINKKYLNK
jgi:hypothetical protein